MKRNLFSKMLILLLTTVTLVSCAPKEVREFLNGEFYAEKLDDYLELVVSDGKQFYEVEYFSDSDKVTISGRAKAKVVPEVEATEAPITVKIFDTKKKKYIAEKETVLKIYPAQHYAADIIARGWKKNKKENSVGYYESKSSNYGANIVAGSTIDVDFYFDTMLLEFSYSSYSRNSSTGENKNSLWELTYSPAEHKIYDKEGNCLYTDKVNYGVEAPNGTSLFLTHIDALDRYFRYIDQTEYLSGLKSTKLDDLLA